MYLNDLLMLSKGIFSDHMDLEELNMALIILCDTGLHANIIAEKIKLCAPECEYLIYTLTYEHVKSQPKKVQ